MKIVGPNDQLRTLRRQRGMTRKQLAGILGLSHFTIGRWERGEISPSAAMLDRLCVLFSCTPQELGFGELAPLSARPQSIVGSTDNNNVSPYALSAHADGEQPSIRSSLYEPCFDPAIPVRMTPTLVGRSSLLADLRARFRSARPGVFIAIHGLPGMGKTALAATIANDEETRAHFSDGVLWTGLGPHPNLQALFNRWGTLLGLSANEINDLNGVEAWSKALRKAVGQRKLLIIVDDAWQLEEALACKIGGEHCCHLVTTRFPTLATQLALENVIQLQELNEAESISLIDSLAPHAIALDEQLGLELVHAVGGLPLALTLIGNYLRTQQESGDEQYVQNALRQLKDASVRLQISEPSRKKVRHSSLPADMPLSLHSIISVTDQLLSEKARAAFYALSLLPAKPESFAEEMALVVADGSADELDQLMDAGLLECTVGDRYLLHQVIADYAHFHLSGAAKRDASLRLISHILEYVKAHQKEHEILDRESSTILTALDLAYTFEQREELIRIVCLFAPFLLLRGFYGQADLHLRRAYEAADALNDDVARANIKLYLGEMALKQSSFVDADLHLQESVELATKANDEECICDALTNRGALAWRMGEYAQAEELAQQGLQLASKLENYERQERALKILSSVYLLRGNVEKGVATMHESLALARRVGDREQECVILSNIGVFVGERDDREQAFKLFKEALVLARQIGHREQTCVLLLNIGNIYKDNGDYERAKEYFQEGLQLARQIRYSEWISVLLGDLGSTFLLEGDIVQGEHYLQESLVVARQVGRPNILCNILQDYGYFYLAQQQYEQAKACFTEMLAEAPVDDRLWNAYANNAMGRVSEALNDYNAARQYGATALQNFEVLGHGYASVVRRWLEELSDTPPEQSPDEPSDE